MRERLKPAARIMALLLFVVIAVLWQRRTGGSVAELLGMTVAIAAATLLAVLGFARLMSGLQGKGGTRLAPGDSRPIPGDGRPARPKGRPAPANGGPRPGHQAPPGAPGGGGRP